MKRQGIQAEGGFTLVEVGLVLAITGLLLAGIVANTAGSQHNSAFTAAIDQLQNTAKQVQNEAAATISDRTGGSTGNSPYVVFGKAMIFSPASPTTYTVATLTGAPGDAVDPLNECDDSPTPLPDGITYQGGVARAIIFTANPSQVYVADNYTATPASNVNGIACSNPGTAVSRRSIPKSSAGSSLMALVANPLSWLVPTAEAALGGGNILNVNNYTSVGPFSGNVTIHFNDPAASSQSGMITVNPSQDTLTRSFLY